MTTYSVRCKHSSCRYRRVTRTDPEMYKLVPRCPKCGNRKGWRVESRAYNKRGLCHCEGPNANQEHGKHFPHRATHPLCDQHPQGFYNQAKARGVADEDIPLEHLGRNLSETDDCPF